MARLHVLPPDDRAERLWALGRWGGLLGFAALLLALVVEPRPALASLWNIAVPLLPASFFVAPAFWRGVCPLSTLNAFGNRLGPARLMTPGQSAAIGALGLVLFHVIVPARHLGLNTDGPLLAGALGAIALLALGLGAAFASRSAFCNALCPVLPVERLYGQAPLLAVSRGRCGTCTVCTPVGCLDLADDKAMRQLIGPARGLGRWTVTPFGLFAASLPGFIIGYGLTPDVGGHAWPRVYAATLGGAAASYAIVALAVRLLRPRPMRAVTACAALSGVLYYWMTAPIVVRNLALPPAIAPGIRGAALVGIGLWAVRALRRAD
ncbi:MAG: hypothetical protein K1X31_09805 [Gemmatimonadaceae bacterium]|nr:hypothetical protein [Gemmatimonadaceae bacterium]